jgi:hypothetical protein
MTMTVLPHGLGVSNWRKEAWLLKKSFHGISDQKIEQRAGLRDCRRVLTPWNARFGLTPEGAPLFMHDVGSPEVYALDFEAP